MKQKRSIIGIIVCIIVFVILAILLGKQNLGNLFVSVKEINNIVDLGKCSQGDYAKIKVAKAYQTEYSYLKDGQDVAKYLDIELNGYALIAVMENKTAEKILNNNDGNIYVQGKLKKIEDGDMLEALDKIKQNYLEDFGTEMSEEEILAMFTSLQLINYGEEKPNIILVFFLIILIIITIIAGILFTRLILLNKKQKEEKKSKKESRFKNV